MVDYYDPLAVSAIGGNALSSTNNPRLGLYSPVNISQHATSPANAANIAKVGFQPGFPGWAGANKIYSSSDPNVLKHYGTSKIGMITPEGNRLPWGGGISKRGVTLSTAGESAVGIEKANKAREFILGFTEDPLETAVRNMEELGLDASKFRLQLLGIKKMNLFQELGVEMHNVKAVEEEIVQTTNKLKMEQEMIGIAVTNRTKAISEMTGTQAEIEARISKEKSRQFRLQEGIGTHGAQTYATQQNMVDKEAEFVVIQQKNENAAKQGVITNKDRLAQLLQILAIIKEMNTIVVGDDDTDDGFFSKLFGKFGNQEEMEALVGNVAQFVDALSGVANAYDKVKMQQINQAKQAELDSVKGIRNERIRTKKLEEIEAKYAEKTRKHKEKMKTVKVAEAISNTALGATKAWSDPGGFLGMALAAMIVAQGALQIQAIKAQKYQYGGLVGGRRHSQGGTMIEAEQGEFVMSRDAVDAVGIENLNRMNTGLGGGGGSTIVINNPILGKDMIEDEIVPQIQEALRRGGDIGV